jgi:NADH-quinone oxidoreductase subunit E
MLEIASQMILCLLLAALLGFIIGYLFGKGTCAEDNCGQEADTEVSHEAQGITTVAEEAVVSTGVAPMLLSGARNGEKDNLTRIKGIGIKIDETLNRIGIYHFDQIADWTEENITWADSTLGFPGRAKRESWVEQAKALAAGEETEFSKRVDAGEVSSSKQV